MRVRNYALTALLLMIATVVRGQSLADYQYSTGNDSSRWYTLDSTRNLLALGSSAYYRTSQLESMGFEFPFADTTYTQFSVTHDGNLRLGSVLALSSSGNQGSPFHPSRAGNNNPKINFMGCAGYSSDSNYVHKQTFGQAPDRVTVVEFALQTYNSYSRPSLLRWQVQMYENGDIEIVYPSQAPPRLPNASHQQGMCVDETDVWIVDENHVATHYTNGCATMIPAGCWPDVNRYYRFAFPVNVCPSPSSLSAIAIGDTTMTLRWGNPGYSSEFLVEYGTSAAAGSGTVLQTSDTVITIEGLIPNTQYHVRVRSVCDVGDTSNAAYIIVRTLSVSPVSEFPYFCDFEEADERGGWIIPHGNLSTFWCVDTAVNNTLQGSYGMYISQDTGRTNTGGDQWIGSYAYRDMNLMSGDWRVTFDWRAYGEWEGSGSGVSYFHFMRAFLVPSSVNFTVQTPASFPLQPHSSAVPNGWIDLNPGNVFVGQQTWTSFEGVVSVPASGCYHLVFYWETDGYPPDLDMPAAVDNIGLEMLQCPQPQGIVAEMTDEEVMLSWQRGGNETLWLLEYDGLEVYVQDTFYLITGLQPNTYYTFVVRAVCGAGDTSLASVATFRTPEGQAESHFPYSCTFEDTLAATQWVVIGDGQTNSWYIGSATNNTPDGTRSIYISSDGGTTNSYDGSTSSISYAYRQFVFDVGDYYCTFDWRCLGDGDFHFMRAFLVPATSLPSAGTFPIANNHYTAVPAGWVDLNPQSHYMSGETDWVTHTTTFTVADSGDYALLLMWENDDYTPGNPPAAVDNIAIGFVSCSIPFDVEALAMQTSVELSWNSGSDVSYWLVEYGDTSFIAYTPSCIVNGLDANTEYTFSISSICYSGDTSLSATQIVRTECEAVASLPYFCDFEAYTLGMGSNEQFIPCWGRALNHSSYTPQISDDVEYGNNCLYWNITSGLLDSVYILLPELDESIDITYTELRFKAMMFDYMGLFEIPTVTVGTMADAESPQTFAPVATMSIDSDTGFADYSVSLDSYEGPNRHVAILATVSGDNYASAMFFMDDIGLYELQVCRRPTALMAETGVDSIALTWSVGGNEQSWIVSYGDTMVSTSLPSYVARGLVVDTEYLFSVRSVCSFGDTSESLIGRFRTDTVAAPPLPPDTVECLPVTDLQITIDDYELTVTWNGEAAMYIVQIISVSEVVYHSDTVTGSPYHFDFEGKAGYWQVRVRPLCEGGVLGEWRESEEFDTPLCIGIGKSEKIELVLSPNPTEGDVVLTIAGGEGTFDVRIYDLTGREVLSVCDAVLSSSALTLPVGGLPSGTYMVRVIGRDGTIVRKLVKK